MKCQISKKGHLSKAFSSCHKDCNCKPIFMTINDSRLQKCDICSEIIESSKLHQHMKGSHDKKMYFCDMCEFSRPYKTHVEKHKERVHKDFSKNVTTYQYFDDDKVENENNQ